MTTSGNILYGRNFVNHKKDVFIMNFTFFSKTTNLLYQEVNSLLTACSKDDDVNYTLFCAEDFEDYSIAVAYEENTLIGFLVYTDDELQESFGIVAPQHRQKGIFTALFKLLQQNKKCEQLTFWGKKNYPNYELCANTLGFTSLHEELLMTFSGKPPKKGTDLDMEFEDNTYYYYDGDNYIGQCSVFEEASTINIYEVSVEEHLRNRGYGRQIIMDVIWDLYNSGKKIQLQVSSTNIPAIKCYTSCGFSITDSILYIHRG